MKIRKRFDTAVAVGAAGLLLAAAAMVFFVALPSLHETGYCNSVTDAAAEYSLWFKLSICAVSLICLLYAMNDMRACRRCVIEPLYKAAHFSYELGNGKFPAPFVIDAAKNTEMNELYKSLNIIRDRLISNANRLRSSYTREVEARRETENTAELKSMLISRMAPDMRVPLNSVAGYLELLNAELALPEIQPDECSAYIKGIRRNIKVMVSMIERLMKIGAIGQNSVELDFRTFDTNELIRQVMQQNEFLLSERSLKINSPFSPGMPETLRTDREILLQLLALMIRGISRASNSGEVIRFFCEVRNNQVEFHVCDSRRAACRERLAEMYNLARRDGNLGNIENASTTVLGMLFIDTQAANIGGRLSAESNQNAHSEFILSFGMADIAAEREKRDGHRTQNFHFADSRQNGEMPEDENMPENSDGGTVFKILLGEEDADNAEVISKILARNNFSVKCGNSASELLRLAENEHFDAAVLSNTMRHRNMVATIRKLLHRAEDTALPIMVLASKINPIKQSQLQSAGVRCVMMKPLDFGAMIKHLRRLCSKS